MGWCGTLRGGRQFKRKGTGRGLAVVGCGGGRGWRDCLQRGSPAQSKRPGGPVVCVNWGAGNADSSSHDQPRSVAAAQACAPRRWHEVPMRETSICITLRLEGLGGGGGGEGMGKKGDAPPAAVRCGCTAVAIPSGSRLGTVALHARLLRPPHDTVCAATTVRPNALGGNGADGLLAVAASQVQSGTPRRPVAIPASPLRERGALPTQSRSRLSQV